MSCTWVIAMVWLSQAAGGAGPATAAAPSAPAAVDVSGLLQGASSDAQRAALLLGAARQAGADLQVGLLERAVEYGLKGARSPDAAKTAKDALDLLDRAAAGRKAVWQEKRLELARLQYRYAAAGQREVAGKALLEAMFPVAAAREAAAQWAAAGELYGEAQAVATGIQSPLIELIAFQRARAQHYADVLRQVEQGKAILKEKADNQVARDRLILLLTAELNQPEEALKCVTDGVDQAWRTYLPMAAKSPAVLPRSQAAELGRWLAKFLAPKASKFSRLAVLRRARACLKRAEEASDATVADRTALLLAVAEAQAEMDRIAFQPETAGWWGYVELLRSLDFDGSPHRGTWRYEQGGLTCWPDGWSHLCLPGEVAGDYRLAIKFAHRQVRSPMDRPPGRGGPPEPIRSDPGMGVAFPVGAGHVGLLIQAEASQTVAKLLLVAPEGQPRGVAGPGGKKGPTGGGRDPDRGGDRGRDDRGRGGPPGPPPPFGRDPRREDPNMPPDRIPPERVVSSTGKAIALDRPHQLDVAVFTVGDQARITVQLDRQPLLQWSGAAARCSLPGNFGRLPEGTVALGGTLGPTLFGAVRLAPLDGDYEP